MIVVNTLQLCTDSGRHSDHFGRVHCVTFSLHALWGGEAAALVVEVGASLDHHTVQSPGLQVGQRHQVSAAAHQLGI